MKLDFEKDKLLILLIFADFVFVILHLLYIHTDLFPSSLYSLSRDRGYSEFFQYTKELWITILFLILGIKQRRGLFVVFSFLFLYFLIDDAFEFHEGFGRFLSDLLHLSPALNLRPVDWGELLVSGIFGLLFAISTALVYFLSDPAARRIGRYLIWMIALLGFFGVGLDMMEIIIDHPGIQWLLVLIEEGGEMLVMSVITWFVFRLDISQPGLPLPWESVPPAFD